MKVVKYIALCAFLAIGMFYVVVYSSSCNKDACKGVTCLNQGKCNGGNCTCDTGTGGSNCQTIYRELYANSYLGNAVVTYSHLDSAQVDSGYFNHTDDSNVISFSIGSDSSYSLMRLTWRDRGTVMLTTPITLTNNTATGSTFSIPATMGGPGDSFSVSGNGSVSTTNASLNLIAVPSHSTTPTIYYTLSNCSKQ